MNNLWLKIKVWSKITLFTVVTIFLLIFIIENANKDIKVWVWFGRDEVQTSLLQLIPSMLLAGVLGTLLVRMAFRTIKQIREIRDRNRASQMQKDVADMRSKAGMLQTKPATPPEDHATPASS